MCVSDERGPADTQKANAMFCLGQCDNGFAGACTGKEGVGKEAEKPSLGRQEFKVSDQKRKSLEKWMAQKSRCRSGYRATWGDREDGDEGTGRC